MCVFEREALQCIFWSTFPEPASSIFTPNSDLLHFPECPPWTCCIQLWATICISLICRLKHFFIFEEMRTNISVSTNCRSAAWVKTSPWIVDVKLFFFIKLHDSSLRNIILRKLDTLWMMMSVCNWELLLHRCKIAILAWKQQEALFVFWKGKLQIGGNCYPVVFFIPAVGSNFCVAFYFCIHCCFFLFVCVFGISTGSYHKWIISGLLKVCCKV